MRGERGSVRPGLILVTNETDGLVYAPKLVTEPPSPEPKDDMQNSTEPKESTTTPPQSR